MQHIDTDELERYCLKGSSELEQQKIEEHLLICEECRVCLSQVEIEIKIIREALRRAQAEPGTETADFAAPDARRREVG
jgi:predicted anti-sigma-YlaC factor YlaD